ncbi:MAG: hypothetical protein GEU82_02550 [Luteitalea sp.]|nr:hypothetical protein [Luteitalea sp.]
MERVGKADPVTVRERVSPGAGADDWSGATGAVAPAPLAGMRPRLRAGVICEGITLPFWQAEAIEQLRRVEGVELALVVLVARPEVPAGSGLSLWRWHTQVSARLRTQPAMEPVDLSEAVRAVPRLTCDGSSNAEPARAFSERDIETIRRHRLDFVLNLRRETIAGGMLEVAPHGIWSFRFPRYEGGPAGFWEVYRGDPLSGLILHRSGGQRDVDAVIREAQFKTVADSDSGNCAHVMMSSATWPALTARLLLQGFADEVFRLSSSPVAPSSPPVAPPYGQPTNLQMAVHLGRLTRNIALKHTSDLFGRSESGPDDWAIGITTAPMTAVIAGNSDAPITWLCAPAGHYYADPFVITRGATTYIFVEDYARTEKKGRIAVIETDDFRTFTAARTVLDRPFHLSYPCVFVHDDRYYCVPEQHRSGEVALYEAEDFPRGWVKRATLLQGFPGVDPTVFQHLDRWWMFVTNRSNDDVTHLYLFFADTPLGPWTAHHTNPVRSDKHKVRPAGMPFQVNGLLVRPAQDCSRTYGGRIELHQITSLTTTDFEEQFLGVVEPRQEWPFAAGLHTINDAQSVRVFDAKRRLMVKHSFRKAARRKLRTALMAAGLR